MKASVFEWIFSICFSFSFNSVAFLRREFKRQCHCKHLTVVNGLVARLTMEKEPASKSARKRLAEQENIDDDGDGGDCDDGWIGPMPTEQSVSAPKKKKGIFATDDFQLLLLLLSLIVTDSCGGVCLPLQFCPSKRSI